MFFKLESGTGDSGRREVLRLARARGASTVRRLFPDASDDLRLHFVAEVADQATARDLVARLNERPDVAFAHRGRRRRPLDPP